MSSVDGGGGRAPAAPGAVALVGSGEYTDAMIETDRYLLDTLGGPADARVALLPTASGLEPGSPERWNMMGKAHFAALGVRDIRPVNILDRASASDPAQVKLLRGASYFYFSGGMPGHIIESLRGTEALQVILDAYAAGAVLAGCSAGAMALAGQTISVRSAMAGGTPRWTPALGVIPGVIVFPHFDRMAGFLGQEAFQNLIRSAPEGRTPVGVDEDTALIRVALSAGSDAPGKSRWRVTGRQTVTIFEPSGPRVLRTGDEVAL